MGGLGGGVSCCHVGIWHTFSSATEDDLGLFSGTRLGESNKVGRLKKYLRIYVHYVLMIHLPIRSPWKATKLYICRLCVDFPVSYIQYIYIYLFIYIYLYIYIFLECVNLRVILVTSSRVPFFSAHVQKVWILWFGAKKWCYGPRVRLECEALSSGMGSLCWNLTSHYDNRPRPKEIIIGLSRKVFFLRRHTFLVDCWCIFLWKGGLALLC